MNRELPSVVIEPLPVGERRSLAPALNLPENTTSRPGEKGARAAVVAVFHETLSVLNSRSTEREFSAVSRWGDLPDFGVPRLLPKAPLLPTQWGCFPSRLVSALLLTAVTHCASRSPAVQAQGPDNRGRPLTRPLLTCSANPDPIQRDGRTHWNAS